MTASREISMRIARAGSLLLFLLALACFARGDDKTEAVIPATEAKSHVGKQATVEMTIRASKNAAPRRTYYLDSEEDFHNVDNVAVIISYDHAEAFQKAGIDDPAEHYRGKKLRVTGKIIAEDDQTRIHVTDPRQITIVEGN